MRPAERLFREAGVNPQRYKQKIIAHCPMDTGMGAALFTIGYKPQLWRGAKRGDKKNEQKRVYRN